MDFPLIEYDLGSAPLSGPLSETAISATQWRPVAPQTIRNLGRSYSFPALSSGTPPLASIWGPTNHATLPVKFAAADRCRQLVFWAVDWQSYEDFETAPSAPVDASKYPKAAPHSGRTFTGLMDAMPLMDWQQFGYRNPEKVIAFIQDVSGQPTGADVTALINGSQANNNPGAAVPGNSDHGAKPAQLGVFAGIYGADRNYNKRLDRGAVPKSQRLRAVTVARFNYYDTRVLAPMR